MELLFCLYIKQNIVTDKFFIFEIKNSALIYYEKVEPSLAMPFLHAFSLRELSYKL